MNGVGHCSGATVLLIYGKFEFEYLARPPSGLAGSSALSAKRRHKNLIHLNNLS